MTSTHTEDVGGIVARFQVDQLHQGHRHFVSEVASRHKKLAVVLGDPGGFPTPDNPLTYEERSEMVRETFPTLDIKLFRLRDHPLSHQLWSKELDDMLGKAFPGESIRLYDSRNGFTDTYFGSLPTTRIAQMFPDSGTEKRNGIVFPHSVLARQAIIYRERHRDPRVYHTSNLAPISQNRGSVLLVGKKKHDGLLEFQGGFEDASDLTIEDTVSREANEELLGFKMGQLFPLSNRIVDDPRYRGSIDKIRTHFFRTNWNGEPVSPGDDVDLVVDVPKEKLLEALVPWHQELGRDLLAWWDKWWVDYN